MSSEIEQLLKLANSTDVPTTSVNSARRNLASEAEARSFFDTVCGNLLDIEQWSENSTPSEYALFDQTGAEIHGRPISEGDFIRISIHGSGKYDWVLVLRILRTEDEMVITVRPSRDPTASADQSGTISHFFHEEARNNFCVQLDDRVVSIYVIGIDERQNVSETGGLVESVRNAAAANLSYFLGIQKGVWNEFCANFLRTEEEKAEDND
jgi:hypothetical protein